MGPRRHAVRQQTSGWNGVTTYIVVRNAEDPRPAAVAALQVRYSYVNREDLQIALLAALRAQAKQ